MRALNLVFLAFLSQIPSLAGAAECTSLSAFYYHYAEQKGEGDVVMVASNNHLREFNTVFGGASQRSEYVTDITHFFYQYYLRQNLKNVEDFQITQRKSPYVKFIVLNMADNPAAHATLTEAAATAKKQAIAAVADVFFGGIPEFRSILQRINGPTSELGRQQDYVFSEGRTSLRLKSDAENAQIGQALKTHYGSWDKFVASLSKGYGVGISKSDLDSHYAAKLSSLNASEFGGVVFFDLESIMVQSNKLFLTKHSLDWLFSGKSSSELVEIFQAVRANVLHDSPRDWSNRYKEILARGGGGNVDGQITAHLQIKEYIKTLNIFDYLPMDSISVDPGMRIQFDLFARPTAALYLDVRQVGAKNYLKLHEMIEPLVAKLVDLDRQFVTLKELEIANADVGEVPKKIGDAYAEIIKMRREVFTETGAFLSDKRAQLIEQLNALGYGEGTYAIWTSGDDIFLVLGPGKSGEEVATALKKNPAFNGDVRVGFMNVPSSQRLPLDQARQMVGKTAEALKFAEALDLGYELVAQYRKDGNQDAVIFAKLSGETLTAVPSEDFSLLELGLTDWRVYNYRVLH